MSAIVDPGPLLDITRREVTGAILVVGDLILDRYVWGTIDRVSPEAPIPVLKLTDETEMPGGAATVAINLSVLGARTASFGCVGDDVEGERLRALLAAAGVDVAGIVTLANRPTTLKTRYLGSVQSAARAAQHVLRVDRETTESIEPALVAQLSDNLEAALADCELVLISDYAKGLLTPALLARLISQARAAGKRVIVDPRLGDDFDCYRGASGITPNRLETRQVTGIAITDEASMKAAAASLVESLDLEFAAVTVDRDGLYLHQRSGESVLLRSRPRAVYDVSGAGDMVLSALGYFLVAGATVVEAAQLANLAAGIEVGKLGVASVNKAELRQELMASGAGDKLKTWPQLAEILNEHRRRRERIVFTNGCFDMLHVGHMKYLQFSRELGDLLVVGLNSDSSIRKLKGEQRPILAEDERVRLLASLQYVDYILIFEEESVLPVIEHVRPDVLVKGGDYGLDRVVGRDFVEQYGGEVVLAPVVEGISTSTIVDRVLEKYARPD